MSNPPPHKSQRPPPRWGFAEWTRIAAFLAGGYGVSPLTASVDKPTVLAFAGALLLAPSVFGRQKDRNEDREDT